MFKNAKLLIGIKATRPRTLIIGLSPVLMGTALAMSDGYFDLLIFFFTAMTALGLQVSANLINDYYDAVKGSDTKERKGPVRVTASGLFSLIAMKRLCVFSFLITLLFGSYLIWQGGLLISLLLVLSLVLAFCYTAGPFPLAYLGLGELFSFFFFGPIALGGTYFLQTKTLSLVSLIAGIAPGAFSCAVLVVNNLRDYEEDKKGNKKTLIVRFGRNFGKCEYLLCLSAAFFLPFCFLPTKPFLILNSLTFIPALFFLPAFFAAKEATDFIALFPKTARLYMLYTILFLIGWML
jgi:1,4-dihydroxy-2-naphthoate polyprenyltransferase